MRNLATILSASVVAGLLVFAGLYFCGAFGSLVGDVVTIRIGSLVLLFALLGFGAAAIALLFRFGFDRADGSLVQRLEQRVAKLEAGRPGA